MKFILAFLVGGLICTIGEVLLLKTKWGSARILVLFVLSGIVLGALGVYKPIVDFAGAGASVPLLGFGNSLAMGAIEGAKTEGIIGALSGGLKSTAAGISAAILFAYLASVFFAPKTKE